MPREGTSAKNELVVQRFSTSRTESRTPDFYSAGGGVHIEPRYRQFPQLTKSQVVQAEFFSGTMWFWILWRFWHDSDAVLGHFPYPDPSQWTDEELGILPDDED
ncbi:NADH dehydrogenase [ubiquinone] 1 beta subcomplex subunit 2, mitochondrial isoform X2 [Neofelis nebulosa]|uniref:NADH dehydrogenase [ubiquinone] 1 beta subcomplex subunit 2, mitochondrial isoform X2 n=1 Tax=Neofelis nebulosa TaxID=61452 RepID=UPI00272CA903|nr:NADH dehydrogenase [ubiquinone] 1 beta subcomplex subunit 2, mitochondrial isoform X2 [Neofelis nebulosa]